MWIEIKCWRRSLSQLLRMHHEGNSKNIFAGVIMTWPIVREEMNGAVVLTKHEATIVCNIGWYIDKVKHAVRM